MDCFGQLLTGAFQLLGRVEHVWSQALVDGQGARHSIGARRGAVEVARLRVFTADCARNAGHESFVHVGEGLVELVVRNLAGVLVSEAVQDALNVSLSQVDCVLAQKA